MQHLVVSGYRIHPSSQDWTDCITMSTAFALSRDRSRPSTSTDCTQKGSTPHLRTKGTFERCSSVIQIQNVESSRPCSMALDVRVEFDNQSTDLHRSRQLRLKSRGYLTEVPASQRHHGSAFVKPPLASKNSNSRGAANLRFPHLSRTDLPEKAVKDVGVPAESCGLSHDSGMCVVVGHIGLIYKRPSWGQSNTKRKATVHQVSGYAPQFALYLPRQPRYNSHSSDW